MRTFVAFLFLFLCPLFWTQASGQDLSEAEVAQIEAEIQKLADSWMDVWAKNDCDAFQSLWNPDVIFQPRGGVIAESLEDIKEQCDQALANRASFSGNLLGTKIKVLSRDAAVLGLTWEGTFHYRDETPPRYYAHSSTINLLVRTEDGWGISFYVNSNDTPQAVGGEG
jgi:uncharacterized protein (TIGR02246 family)